MENMPRDQRLAASVEDPRWAVYFDGMLDLLSKAEFEQHTWHVAYAGPLTSPEGVTLADESLTLDRLTGEPIFELSPGWTSAVFEHAYLPDPTDERYCATLKAIFDDAKPSKCCQHARYHSEAPENLRNAPARVHYQCTNGIGIGERQPRCTETAAMFVNHRAYCAPCGAAISIVVPATRQ